MTGIPVWQVEDSAAEECGVDAALRTEVCCLRVLRVVLPVREVLRVDVVPLDVVPPPCPQSHSCH